MKEAHRGDSLTIPYIAWEIQLTCNMGCEFCYSSSYNRFRRSETRDAMSLSQIVEGLSVLRGSGLGVELINWSGGEPLLRYRELPAILEASRRHGFRNIISTNGMFSTIPGLGDRTDPERSRARFEKFLREDLSPNLDWLSISWDSAEPRVNNDIMRLNVRRDGGSTRHYGDVRAIIDMYRGTRLGFALKVNTLVTAKNVGDSVVQIGDHLGGIPVVWKLVEFNPRECPPEFRSVYRVDPRAFEDIVARSRERYEGKSGYEGLRIATRRYDGDIEPYCFLVVNSSGEILLPRGEAHVGIARLGPYEEGCDKLALAERIERRLVAELASSPALSEEAAARGVGALACFFARNARIARESYRLDSFELEPLRLQ